MLTIPYTILKKCIPINDNVDDDDDDDDDDDVDDDDDDDDDVVTKNDFKL